MKLLPAEAVEDRGKTLVNLQWLVVVATSYLVLFRKAEAVQDPWAFALIIALLASVLALHHLSDAAFEHRLFAPTLAVADTLLISAAIWFNREAPWDLFLIFFFCLFIATVGEGLMKTMIACLLVAVLSIMVDPFAGRELFHADSDLLFRIPFLFGVSILYSYLVGQARTDRNRAEKAEETERIKRRLVSSLAHDIKNPLGIVMGYTEAVQENLVQENLDSPEAKENLQMLDRVQESARRIVKLVTGFLEASKAEDGKMNAEPTALDINAILREVSQQQMGLLRQKEISLAVELEPQMPRVLGDALQLDRVFWNLIDNATKFTPKGGSVRLRSWAENGDVCASVSDTGAGIPREDLPGLFTEFGRLKGAGKVEGTGLGLFIVKTIVAAHHGTVEAASERDKGSTFTVRLPAQS